MANDCDQILDSELYLPLPSPWLTSSQPLLHLLTPLCLLSLTPVKVTRLEKSFDDLLCVNRLPEGFGK